MKSKNIDFLGQGWSFPIVPIKGKIAFAAGDAKIRQSIILILSTSVGERVMHPTFGSRLKELTFSPNNASIAGMAAYYAKQSLVEWEPRITVIDVQAAADTSQLNLLNISINYIVRATNVPFNLVYPFYIR